MFHGVTKSSVLIFLVSALVTVRQDSSPPNLRWFGIFGKTGVDQKSGDSKGGTGFPSQRLQYEQEGGK